MFVLEINYQYGIVFIFEQCTRTIHEQNCELLVHNTLLSHLSGQKDS